MHEPIATPRQHNMRQVEAIAQRHGVTAKAVMAYCRTRAVVRARYESFSYFRALGWSMPKIGKFFGRDHTTVLHGLRRFDEMGAAR